AVVFFISTAFILNLGIFYLIGVLIAMVLLFKQHTLVSPEDLSRAGVAFFNLNGTLSIVMFVFTLLDVLFPLHLF
ncbi:MAG: 4-hydroxybenzoate octaprenyltransferase, partial [Desulfofundulus sp.]